ncbi:LPS biosynthesis protein WbpP, partial [Calditrichota bacterium]
QSRDFTYIDNVVSANLLACKATDAAGEVMNMACGERITLNQLVEILQKILGINIPPSYDPPRPGDIRHSLADIEKAKKLLGYKVIVPMDEGLKKTAAWFKNYYNFK